MFYLITFKNTHTAIETKKKLTGLLAFRTIPTLREISASCGISLKVENTKLTDICDILDNNHINNAMYSIYEIHIAENSNKIITYKIVR